MNMARRMAHLLASAAVLIASPAMAENFQITLASGHPAVSRNVADLHDFLIPEIDRRLAETGEHTITWTEAYGGSLASVFEVLEAVENGIADIGYVPSIFEADKLPLAQFTYAAPFGTDDLGTQMQVVREMYAEIPELEQEWLDHNQRTLAIIGVDTYHILTSFEWSTVDDLKGHKIGAAGMSGNWLRDSGATVVAQSLPEYYNSMKTGLIDGLIIFESAIAPYKFQEVAPYITKVNFGANFATALTINSNVWDSLPEEVQNVISEVSAEYEQRVIAYNEEAAQASLDAAVAGGATISDFPEDQRVELANRLPNIAREWAEARDARGIAGTKVLEAYVATSKEHGVSFARDWLAE